MSVLFTGRSIGTLEIPNRIIRAASHEGLADERGRPTDRQWQFYERLVKGGVGLVITGYAGVAQSGKSALRNMTMMDSDELISSHRTLVNRIHEIGGKIVLQIAHCGRQTWSGETGMPLLAPSAMECKFYRERPWEMQEREILQVIKAFAEAAGRAREAGYDGVEIHAAHGYLLSSFLSGHSNKRKDKWGGSPENRFRIVAETLRAVKNVVGKNYPVLIKMNTYEKVCHGIKPEDSIEFAKMVEETGCCDAIELSCGTNECGFVMTRGAFPYKGIVDYMRPYCEFNTPMKWVVKNIVGPLKAIGQPSFEEGYNLPAAARVKKDVTLPVITVGGVRSKRFMEEAIQANQTDFFSMARPLILEPDLPNKFRSGLSEKALCNSCNVCVVAADTQTIRCHNKELLSLLKIVQGKGVG